MRQLQSLLQMRVSLLQETLEVDISRQSIITRVTCVVISGHSRDVHS